MTEDGGAAATLAGPPAVRRPRGRRIGVELYDIAATPSFALRMCALVLGLGIAVAVAPLLTTSGSAVYESVWQSTFGTALGINQLIELSMPLILAGCAYAIAQRVGLWNVGVEGQLFIGAWAGTGVAFAAPHLSGPVLVVLMLLGGMAGGAVWILVPALLRAYLAVSEVLTTLMLNFVALLWFAYWVSGPWSASEQGQGLNSRPLPAQAVLPDIHLGQIAIGTSALISVALAAILALLWRSTIFGYRAALLEAGERVGTYAGINVRRTMFGVLLLSGALGGLVGILEELNYVGQYSQALSNNTGYMGIVVAFIAGCSLIQCIPVGFAVALVVAYGNAMRLEGVGGNIVLLFTGLLLLLVALANVAARYRIRFRPVAGPDPDDRQSAERSAR